jgi:hypothetical protein
MKHYLKIRNGVFTETLKNEEPGTVPRVNKNGVTVYDRTYHTMSCLVSRIWVNETKYGKVLSIDTTAPDGVEFTLQCDFESSEIGQFIRRAPNMDFTKFIEFIPFSMDDKKEIGRKVTGWWFTQEGKKVLEAIPTSSVPRWSKVSINGKDVWDRSAEFKWIEETLANTILPKLLGLSDTTPANKVMPKVVNINDDDIPLVASEANVLEPAVDDLPF